MHHDDVWKNQIFDPQQPLPPGHDLGDKRNIPFDMFVCCICENTHKSLKLTLQLKLNDISPFNPSACPQGAGSKQ